MGQNLCLLKVSPWVESVRLRFDIYCVLKFETDSCADFKTSPFYEVLETVLPLQDLPGNKSFFFPFLKDTLTMLIQVQTQKCRKIATRFERSYDSTMQSPNNSNPTNLYDY